MSQIMLFSDIKKKLVDANIIGNLKKKKIKFITDHSQNTNSNTLLVINNTKKFKTVYLKKAINNPRYIVYTAIEYPKKPKDSKQRMTGAVVNAPLVKKIILEMIKILNIPPYKQDNILKADIKNIYETKYAFL